MTRRPDGPAILGLLILAGVLSVGALVLIGMERTVPPEVWALIAGAVGAVGGWVGKTLTSEPLPETSSIDVLRGGNVQESAESGMKQPVAANSAQVSTPAVYPIGQD